MGKSFLTMVLDQGGQSSRALVYSQQGDLICQASREVATMTPKAGFVEQDSVAVYESLQNAANAAYQQLSEQQRSELLSVGLVCQRSSLVFWRRSSGTPLTPVISWQDRRGHKILEQKLASGEISRETIVAHTGLYPNAHFGASKINWCLNELPEIKEALTEEDLYCGPLMSYLLYQLCEETPFLVDGGNASRTMLWNVYRQQWDKTLLDAFDVPESILPITVHNSSAYGHMQVAGKRIPVTYANGDQNAAFFALGYIDINALYINLGTGGFCSALWQDNVKPAGRLLKSVVAAQASPVYMIEGTVNGAASAINWAFKQLSMQADFSLLNNYLDEVVNPPLCLNGIGGLASPFWQPDFVSCFIENSAPNGSEIASSNEAKLVAVLESILFLVRCNYELMIAEEVVLDKVQISGGLSRIDGMCQRLANLLALPVHRADETEASARGTAFWMSGCPQNWQDINSDRFTPQASDIIPRYRRWLRAMDQALKE